MGPALSSWGHWTRPSEFRPKDLTGCGPWRMKAQWAGLCQVPVPASNPYLRSQHWRITCLVLAATSLWHCEKGQGVDMM